MYKRQGGKGTRLYPLSRSSNPKQFLSIHNNGKSFLSNTVDRIRPIIHKDNIYVVTNQEYEDKIRDELKDIRDCLLYTSNRRDKSLSNKKFKSEDKNLNKSNKNNKQKVAKKASAKNTIIVSNKNEIRDEVRLNKYISETGFCSRREADKLIEQGRVTVSYTHLRG